MEVVSSAHIDGVVQTSPSLRRRSVVPPAVEVSRIASGALGESSQTREGDKAGDLADFFSCSICLELAHDPVVTVCGHLHCWPCLYRWKEAKESNECPVCKAALTDDKIIPLYGRGTSARDPRKYPVEGIPARPAAHRPPTASQNSFGNVGLGMMPLLGVHMRPGAAGGSQSALLYGDPVGPDAEQQVLLSRMLLMLGSFVIMCLLLF